MFSGYCALYVYKILFHIIHFDIFWSQNAQFSERFEMYYAIQTNLVWFREYTYAVPYN